MRGSAPMQWSPLGNSARNSTERETRRQINPEEYAILKSQSLDPAWLTESRRTYRVPGLSSKAFFPYVNLFLE